MASAQVDTPSPASAGVVDSDLTQVPDVSPPGAHGVGAPTVDVGVVGDPAGAPPQTPVASPNPDSSVEHSDLNPHGAVGKAATRGAAVTTAAPDESTAPTRVDAQRGAPVGRPAPESRSRRPLALLASALLVAVVAVGVVDLVRLVLDRPQVAAVNSTSSRDAVTAAVNAAKPMLAYNYKTTVAAKTAAAAPLLTAGCSAAYSKDLNALASTLDPLKVVETAQVSSAPGYAGVQSTADGEVTVLVFAVQTATNSRLTTPSVTPLQVSFTMVHHGGRWLVDGIVAKGSGGSNNPVC